MVVGRLLSYWEGNFSGAMLNFGGVTPVANFICYQPDLEKRPAIAQQNATFLCYV